MRNTTNEPPGGIINLPSSSLASVDFGGTSRRNAFVPPFGIPLVDLTNCNFILGIEIRVVFEGVTSRELLGCPGGIVLRKIFAGNVMPEKLVIVKALTNRLTPEPFGLNNPPQAFVPLPNTKVCVCPTKYLPLRDLNNGFGILTT